MVRAGLRRLSAAVVVLALLTVVFIAFSTALAVNSIRAEQRSVARSNFLLTSESEAANLVFSQREVGNVVVTTYAWLAGLASRRDEQIARALLERRLSITSESGPNPAATDERLRQALSEFDAAFAEVPAGTLTADQRDAWAARLSPTLSGLDFSGKQLVTQYQQKAAQRARDLAVAQAQQERRQTFFAIGTILSGLVLVVTTSFLLYRRIRRTRNTLDVEAANLAEAVAALRRAEQLQEDQSRMLEAIAKGAAVVSLLPLAARVASLVTPGARAHVTCGEVSIIEPTGEHGRSDDARWMRELDDLCGMDPSHRGILEIRTRSALTPAAQEEAEAVADLLRIAIERDRDARALIKQARHDSLTGLPNRTSLMERLGELLDERPRGGRRRTDLPTTEVLFIDLDRFKVVNDSMGHKAGDQLLAAVARRLDMNVRSNDELFRLSGDEFVVVSAAGPGGGERPDFGRADTARSR